MEPHWLNNDELGLWMRLHGLSERLLSDVDSQLRRDAGLTRYEYYVLAMLSESPTRSRLMSELALATNGSLSRLSHAATKLEANGWLTRSHAAGQRRSVVATLTDEGWDKICESAPGHVAAVRERIFDHLTPEQAKTLYEALAPLFNGTCPR
ncbi:MarR family winged helix-turn-helix transcriptional regulator [Kutzneria chonburiensis]|uniref:MarR family winged helix-turn-helix transcriptional regulator n=1 Tax=Kutzneria chonburiensis TaxID=1483604 RepID=A0ABV6MIZ9_9PSEU|nr:MarR family transcriptional regulator [Kutzneria chonburiensis]